MSMILTYWEDPRSGKNDPEDYEGLFDLRLKSVKEIPQAIRQRPSKCTMISTQHTGFRTLKNGRKTNFFKQVWVKGQPIPLGKSCKCLLCGRIL